MEKGKDGSLFRSEDMSFVRLYVEKDTVHDVVEQLGWVGQMEFVDLNPQVSAFQRAFAADIKRCDEFQRKFRLFREHLEAANITVYDRGADEPAVPLSDIEISLTEQERELLEVTRHHEYLSKALNSHMELMAVLTRCMEMCALPDLSSTLEGADIESTRHVTRISSVAGCLPTAAIPAFERIVFRATRGNCFTQTGAIGTPLIDSRTGKPELKTVFITFFAGLSLGRKISKIAESLGAVIYDVPLADSDRQQRIEELRQEILERQSVLLSTQESRRQLLRNIATTLPCFERTVARELAVFHTLNLFESRVDRRALEAEGWCPKSALPHVQRAVDRAGWKSSAPRPILQHDVATSLDPPTHFQTNRLTSPFQAIVDAYGVANYKEFNPAPFTVITFPFLFAVMFGDFGHGAAMFMFALYLVLNEKYYIKNPPGEIFGICFGGRYVILLMSIFSMYTGLLYNDTFALSMNLFDSPYKPVCDEIGAAGCERYHFSNYKLINGHGCPAPEEPCVPIFDPASRIYPFGVDPIWKQSTNELSFTNSMKMKLSIVLGVIQMEFGVFLSGLNHIYYRDWISFIHEFIPQVLFLTSVFGYMVLVIFIKWGSYYENTHCAPSILTLFIDMFLQFGTINYEPGCQVEAYFFDGQESIEKALLFVAGVSVPWMLFTKPILMKRKHARQTMGYTKAVAAHDDEFAQPEHTQEAAHGHGHGHGFDFAEEMVHQCIHTIEFVLGAVSNTASYLRLWALSLAHAQLSTVFWEKVMVENMNSGFVVIVVAFVVWTCCSLAVLMVMESLSAFLHALRLHWVEFQNKFYKGAGRKFVPFRFAEARVSRAE